MKEQASVPEDMRLKSDELIRIKATKNGDNTNEKFTIEINAHSIDGEYLISDVKSVLKDVCDLFGFECRERGPRMTYYPCENRIKDYRK